MNPLRQMPLINSVFKTLVLALAFCFSGNLAAENEPEQTGVNWMQALPDEKALTQITIPGTHNTVAHFEPWPHSAACQKLELAEQLEAGIRFLDLRCRHLNDDFLLYHGAVSQKQTFDQAIATLSDFLTHNPSETVIVSIAGAAKAKGNSSSFETTLRAKLKKQEELWYQKEKLPKLEDARGKLVLFRRFNSEKALGFDASQWPHAGYNTSKSLWVQDRFRPSSSEKKWEFVENSFTHVLAKQPTAPQTLFLNYTSGYLSGRAGIPNITAVSKHVNPLLLAYLEKAPHRPHGVLVVDHVDEKLAKAIYGLNF